ncbi:MULTISPECIES: hypothetical protein [Halorussus]|uniref:hypothetical protein n=1 Tax=Halorussus TaxID=1070314 RepID=UPI00209CC9AB|nr:hypothetical protein [Halorussus vallis]USZ75668.1 hypothetical protein NGM07_19845 [Halorussus vallis]USZ75723.1 hypothetical protein NGM07_20125 [Halorussus vallis]USZ75741.1 hypothetical protein NGM07_00070 [Halorussus vallis]
MTSFSTKSLLQVEVEKSSLRDARKEIQSGIGDVTVQVDASSASSQLANAGGGDAVERASRERAMSRQLLDAQTDVLSGLREDLQERPVLDEWEIEHDLSRTRNDLLRELLEVTEKGNLRGRAGGGGLGGMLGGTLSIASLIGKVGASALITGTVGISGLISGSIGAYEIVSGTVKSVDLISGTVSATDLITGIVPAADILNGTVGIASFITGTITISEFIKKDSNGDDGGDAAPPPTPNEWPGPGPHPGLGRPDRSPAVTRPNDGGRSNPSLVDQLLGTGAATASVLWNTLPGNNAVEGAGRWAMDNPGKAAGAAGLGLAAGGLALADGPLPFGEMAGGALLRGSGLLALSGSAGAKNGRDTRRNKARERKQQRPKVEYSPTYNVDLSELKRKQRRETRKLERRVKKLEKEFDGNGSWRR